MDICAISTPLAEGGIAVIRISGETAIENAARVFRSRSGKDVLEAKTHTILYGEIIEKETVLDDCLLSVFRAPKSYTGENIAELSVHGGVYSARRVLSTVLKNGSNIKIADAGEFTRRALLNGKITLTQAEAVADIISATNEKALFAAEKVKDGAIYKIIQGISEKILDALAIMTASLDFAENGGEEYETENDLNRTTNIIPIFENSKLALEKLLLNSEKSRIIKKGVDIALAGKPNSGKSTVMNLLCGERKSIVSDIAGTTRDAVEGSLEINGLTVNIFDCAGIRKTNDVIEKIGVEIAAEKIAQSDIVLALFDGSTDFSEEDYELLNLIQCKNIIYAVNKSDILRKLPKVDEFNEINFSAKNPETRDLIISALAKKISDLKIISDDVFLSNERQINAAKNALDATKLAIAAAQDGEDLDVLHSLTSNILDELFELSGESVSEKTLDEVFSKFCVGK